MQGKRVAVMQPYFFPYAGYLRLFAAVDEFVIFDCVQFPRRGRVHRTEVPSPAGGTEWLTLPLARQPRDVLIRDLAFAPDARAAFDERLARHPWIASGRGAAADRVRTFLHSPMESVAGFLEGGLRLVADILGIDCAVGRSSELGLDGRLRGQERVVEAAASVGATRYVNAPGGRDLYQPAGFEQAGIELSFLPPYEGPYRQLLPALLEGDPGAIRQDILDSTRLVAP